MVSGAVVAFLVLKVTTTPPSPVTVRAEARCPHGPTRSVEATSPQVLRIELPCAEASVDISADGCVPVHLKNAQPGKALHVVLERYARLKPARSLVHSSSSVKVWWKTTGRTARRLDLSDEVATRLVPATGCLAVFQGDRLPVFRPLKLEPGDVVALDPPPHKTGVYVRGVVVDDEGNAVSARITARPVKARLADAGVDQAKQTCQALAEELGVRSTETTGNGVFQIGPLSRRAWTIEATARGFAPAAAMATAGKGPEINVGTLKMRTIGALRIRLDRKDCPEPPPYTVGVDRELNGWETIDERWQQVTSFTSDGSQPKVLPDLSPGYYRVRVDRPHGRLHAVAFTMVLQNDEQGVVVRLAPFRVSGAVRRSDEPVARAKVRFLNEGRSIDTETDDDGNYSIDLWTPADYGVLAQGPDDQSPYPQQLDLSDAQPGDEKTFDIDLPARKIAGVVVDRESGDAVETARVGISEGTSSPGTSSSTLRRSESRPVQADGSFVFSNLTGVPITVTASAEGYLPSTVTVDPADPSAQQLRLELEKSEGVRGRVVNTAGSPVAGAQVMCCPAGASGAFVATSRSDETGEFSLQAKPGAIIWATARGYTFGWARASEREPTVVVLHPLQGGAGLRLVTQAGDPVPAIQPAFSTPDGLVIPALVVQLAGGTNGVATTTNQQGRLLLQVFPPGTYQAWLPGTSGLRPLGVVPAPSSSPVLLTVPRP